MPRLLCLAAALIALTGAVVGQVRQEASVAAARQETAAQQARRTIDTYCVGCHNARTRTAGLAFDTLTLDTLQAHAEVWEAAVRKLRGRLMPPPTSRQPSQTEIDGLVRWLEAGLDAAAPAGPTAGYVPIQRLTRTEFATTVNDLLGLELDAAQLLPPEIEVNGFDNIAAALSMSPAFLDQYVAAARLAARLAVGESQPKVSSATYAYRGTAADQASHVDGLPLGTRGGMVFRHRFAADGEYRFTIPDLGIDLYTFALETRHTLVILIDGQEVWRGELGGDEDRRIADREGAPGRAKLMQRFANIPIQVKAGTRDVAVTFIERARVESDEFVGVLRGEDFSRGDRQPRLVAGVQVRGPFDAHGPSATPSRSQVFVCRPAKGQEQACARQITTTFARRAFRRPVTDDEVAALMAYFDDGARHGFDAGVERMIAAVLVSPDFLFRAIHVPADARPGRAFPLTDLELASRLSFFLWSQGPDAALLDTAAAGMLHEPRVLRAQAVRMLKDRRAASLVRNFALKALDLDKLAEVVPDPNLFPTFTDALRRDMATEAELFLSSILLEDRDVGELLTADHTFLDERLARHYGVAGVFGPQFRRVTLADPRRWGLLGKGAVLLRTSYGDRTSPVLRGSWVLGKLMGTPPTPPPPDVDTNLTTATGEAPKTVRARLEQHRSKPGCNQCHGVIDPIGLAMENFDAIGRWRDEDGEAHVPIDARTVLPNGTPVEGPVQLRAALFDGRDLFVRGFTEKLMMYALGRQLQASDLPQVRAAIRAAAPQHDTLPALVSAIVSTDAFRMQALPAANHDAAKRVSVNKD